MAAALLTSTTRTTTSSLQLGQGDYPLLQVEVAFGASYEGITQYVRDVSTNRGRSIETQPASAGTATLTLSNLDGRFSPYNPLGPYAGKLVPVRPMRAFIEWAGTRYPIYSGYIQSWIPAFPSGGADDTVTIQALDAFSILSNAVVNSTAFGAQLSTDRVSSVMTWGGVNLTRDVLAWSSITLPAEVIDGTDPLSYIQAVADTELAYFYVKPSLYADGVCTFEPRSFRSATEGTSRFTFGEDALGGEIAYQDIVLDGGASSIINSARVTPMGASSATVVEDAASIAAYGRRRQDYALKTTDATWAYQLGQSVVGQYAQGTNRVRALSFVYAAVPTSQLPSVLAMTISSNVLVRRRPRWSTPGLLTSTTLTTTTSRTTQPTNIIEQASYVEGISHSFGPHYSTWRATISTSAAGASAFFALDSPTTHLDSTRLVL